MHLSNSVAEFTLRFATVSSEWPLPQELKDSETETLGEKKMVVSGGQVFFYRVSSLRFVFDWISSIYTYFHMIQIHIASAIHLDRAEGVLNWKERGTIESENSSGYERVKSRWETTQKSLPVEDYLQWLEQRKAVHSYNTITSTYVQVSSLSLTANLTH